MPDSFMRLPSLPTDTAHATRAIFNLTNAYLIIGDQAERWLETAGLTDQSPASDRSTATRIRLAFITIFQFAEDLPDRLATDAVHTRMDWKYALHLPLNSPGFDYTLLREYREQLARDPSEQRLLHYLIRQMATTGLLPMTARKGVPVADVLTSVDNLSRIEDLFEALSAALGTLAACHPDWLRHIARPHWYECYTRLPAGLPHDRSEQVRLAGTIGEDAAHLLDVVQHETNLTEMLEVCSLKHVYDEQFELVEDKVKWKLPR